MRFLRYVCFVPEKGRHNVGNAQTHIGILPLFNPRLCSETGGGDEKRTFTTFFLNVRVFFADILLPNIPKM